MLEKKYIYLIIALFGISGLFLYFTVDEENSHVFKLESFDVSRNGVDIVSDRLCALKVTNTAIQESVGARNTVRINEVSSDNSPFFIDHPEFSFTNINNNQEYDGFVLNPKIICYSGLGSSIEGGISLNELNRQQQVIEDACIDAINEGKSLIDDPVCDVVNFETIVVKSGELTVQVISENIPSDEKIVTYERTFSTDRTVITNGVEKEFGEIKVLSRDIFDDLDSGNYNSFQEFRVFGTVELITAQLENNQSIDSWIYNIPNNALPTFFNVNVDLAGETVTNNVETENDDTENDDSRNDDTGNNDDGRNDDTGNNDENNQNTSTVSGDPTDPISLISEFQDCVNSNQTGCLNQGKFLGIFAVITLIIFMIFIGIISLAFRRRN